MNTKEKFYKDYKKRKWIYLIITLAILTLIVFVVSFGIFKAGPKWYIFLIVFFIGRGITNFLLNRYYTADKAFNYIIPDDKNENEIKVSQIKQNNDGTNYVKLIIDFLINGKSLKLEGYIIDDCIIDDLAQIIENQTAIKDIEYVIENGKKTISYYLEDFSFDIDFEMPTKDKSDMEKAFDVIDDIMNNPENV